MGDEPTSGSVRQTTLKPLLWSDPSPPNTECHYDHTSADTSLGRFQIEWKSWKKYDAFCLYFRSDFIDAFNSLTEAKDGAALHLAQIVAGVMEAPTDA